MKIMLKICKWMNVIAAIGLLIIGLMFRDWRCCAEASFFALFASFGIQWCAKSLNIKGV